MGRRARSTDGVIDPFQAADLADKLAELQAGGHLSRRDLEALSRGLDAITIQESAADRERFRNRWVAMDFRAHRGVRNREKIVAARWGLNARQVAKIGSRHQAEAARRMEGGAHTDEQWRAIIAHVAAALVSPVRTN